MKPLFTFLSSKWIGVLNFASVKARDASDVCHLVTSFIIHLENQNCDASSFSRVNSAGTQRCVGDLDFIPSSVGEMPAVLIAG